MREIPHSLELEQGCLSCLVGQPAEAVTEFLATFPAGEKLFWDERNRTLFGVLATMVDEGLPVDEILLLDELKKRKILTSCGGPEYINKLYNNALPMGALSHYAEPLVDLHVDRQLIMVGDKLQASGMARGGRKSLDEAERDVLAISVDAITCDDANVKVLVRESLHRLEESYRGIKQEGISTGLRDLDDLLRGMKPGQLIVIAARPSKGKTSLAMNIVEHVSLALEKPVGVFSLEMSRDELVDRMLASIARIPLSNFLPGKASENDFATMMRASVQVGNAKLRIVDTGGLSIMALKASARRMVRRWNVELIVVDYIQLMGGQTKENRTQEVSEISRGLKAMAKELRVPVIALSQLNRQSESDQREPRLSDLRESGSIEQDADTVVMIHDPKDDDGDVKEVRLLVRKNRTGATGTVEAMFLRSITRFESKAKGPL